MKVGKGRLANILSKETGIQKSDIRTYGRYDSFGNKEMITIGAHTIVAIRGKISVTEPVYKGEEIRYETRVIEEVE